MKKIRRFLLAGIMSLGLAVPLALPVSAIDVFDQCTDVNVDSAICESSTEGESEDSLPTMAEIIVNTLLALLGMVSVVMIVVGGFRYTLSRGEASEVKTAKDIILYSAVGLIVAILAYAIVNFVLGWF